LGQQLGQAVPTILAGHAESKLPDGEGFILVRPTSPG
jgi:hypothetical protein